MPSASASETQSIGQTGEAEIPGPMAIFGHDNINDIAHTADSSSKSLEEMYI